MPGNAVGLRAALAAVPSPGEWAGRIWTLPKPLFNMKMRPSSPGRLGFGVPLAAEIGSGRHWTAATQKSHVSPRVEALAGARLLPNDPSVQLIVPRSQGSLAAVMEWFQLCRGWCWGPDSFRTELLRPRRKQFVPERHGAQCHASVDLFGLSSPIHVSRSFR